MYDKENDLIVIKEKTKELQEMNAIPHFKRNIANWDNNCTDPITEKSKYCFTCKQSVCPSCSEANHDHHLLLNRKDYLFCNEPFYTPYEKIFNEVLPSDQRKQKIKTAINESFNSLFRKIEQLRLKKLTEVDQIFNAIDDNYKEFLTNFDNAKKSIAHYYKSTSHFYQLTQNNLDLENALFIINFEMINLFDKKTQEAFEAINTIHSKIKKYNIYIKDSTDKQLMELDAFLDKKLQYEPFDNFYWDIKLRTKTYFDQINQFKTSISNTLKESNGMEKLTELLNVFDSKNKKGIDFIYNQQYFVENFSPEFNTMKIKGNSRHYTSISPGKLTRRTEKNITTISNTSGNGWMTGRSSPLQNGKNANNGSRLNQYSACLDNRVFQRLFCYSILDTYNKCFNNSNDRSTFNTNLLLENYVNRENTLKEIVKPIIASNEISIFNPGLSRLTKYTIKLDKDKHGYAQFPHGSRHIFIEGKLYITGGVDLIGNEITVVLSIDIKTLRIERLESMSIAHSYHSIDYLDNYDCFIVIGGDYNASCELFDLFTKKWIRLPNLNYWRANTNIYYDNVTSDIYALFGMVGTIKESITNNTDVIEVLELKDITSGWIKVDYYKCSEFDLKLNYCNVLPYTRDKLMIYGAAKSRMKKKCFALFDLKKNEIYRFNENMIETIRIDELRKKEDEEKIKFDH